MRRRMSILCIDIGGTKANGCVIDREAPQRRRHAFTVPSQAGDLAALLRRILATLPERPRAAALAVPGPVIAGTAVMSNLGWREDERAVAAATGLERVVFANDLVATAHGLDAVAPERIDTIHPGAAGTPAGDGDIRALVAPGTGLGAAFSIRVGGAWRAFASEGGHAGFAPRTPEQADLWRFAQARAGAVMLQTLTSGRGIALIHAWLAARGEAADTPEAAAAIAAAGDPSAAVCAHAATSPRCARALAVFAELVALECGDCALRLIPTGGVWLCGGLPARLPAFFAGPAFRAAYLGHGDLPHLVAMVPVRLVRDADTALYGACALGSTL